MTDTDTRAALDAAIDDWRRLRGLTHLTGGAQAAQAARDRVDRAITAHVEAEVTRRLAVAPSVDDALAAYGTAVYDLGYVLHRPDRDAVLRPVKDVAEATLRAAIAADRERALREATEPPRITSTTGVVPVVADADGRMLGGRREGRDTIYDQVKVPVGAKALPTPDEARRLVDALSDAAYDAGVAVERRAGDGWRESVEKKRDDARAALLRALGVEA